MTVRIVCHMISSVDGRLLVSRWSKPAQPVDISSVYEQTASRLHADGWIVGRQTMAEYAPGITQGEPSLGESADRQESEPFAGLCEGRPLAVVWDPKGKLHFSGNSLPTGEHLVVVLSTRIDPKHLQRLREQGVSYVFSGCDGRDYPSALQSLEKLFSVKTLLLEGGGILNGSFLQAGMIDEWSILIYPGIDGLFGEPAIVGYRGKEDEFPAQNVRLELTESQVLAGGVVWLRYRDRRA